MRRLNRDNALARLASANAIAKYHDEHARYGGASREFHERSAALLRELAEANVALVGALADIMDAWEAREDGCQGWSRLLEEAEQAVRAMLEKKGGLL